MTKPLSPEERVARAAHLQSPAAKSKARAATEARIAAEKAAAAAEVEEAAAERVRQADERQLRAESLLRERRDFVESLSGFSTLLKECFESGSRAASEQREELVDLVKVVANNLATGIGNLHNAAVELAQERARGPDEDRSKTTEQIALLTQLVAAQAGGAPPAKANGKPHGKKPPS